MSFIVAFSPWAMITAITSITRINRICKRILLDREGTAWEANLAFRNGYFWLLMGGFCAIS
jgi:hypothetical protein